jgi:hypothetical protein
MVSALLAGKHVDGCAVSKQREPTNCGSQRKLNFLAMTGSKTSHGINKLHEGQNLY